MLAYQNRLEIADDEQYNSFLDSHTTEVNQAVAAAWNNPRRECNATVLFYNELGQIIYDTNPVNDYTALIEAEIDTQKTALFGSHSASGYVKVYEPYLNKHLTDSLGGLIVDYVIVKFLILYTIHTSIFDGTTEIGFTDYVPTQFIYISSEERQNSKDTVKYIGYDWIEYNTSSWTDYLEQLPANTNVTLSSVCTYLNAIEALIHQWSGELYTQQIKKDKLNFSSSATTTLRNVLDAFGEAYGIDIIQQVEVTNGSHAIGDTVFSESILLKSHSVLNVNQQSTPPTYTTKFYDIQSQSIYNFKDYGDGASLRINSINIYNNLGNKMAKTLQGMPSLGLITYNNAQYHIYNNAILQLQPYSRLEGETTESVPFTLEDYAGYIIRNDFTKTSLSDALYYPCAFSYTCNPLLQVGDPIHITWNNQNYYTIYCGGCVRFNGGLRCDVDLDFVNDIFSGDNVKDTVGSAVTRIEANIDYQQEQIQLAVDSIADNAEQIRHTAGLIIDKDGIRAEVSEMTTGQFNEISQKYDQLKSNVDVLVDPALFSVKVNKSVNSVTTTNGMTFNETGLNITNNNSNTYTNINTNGLYVNKTAGDTNLLTADSSGVKANTLEIINGAVIGKFKITDNGNKIAFYFLG